MSENNILHRIKRTRTLDTDFIYEYFEVYTLHTEHTMAQLLKAGFESIFNSLSFCN